MVAHSRGLELRREKEGLNKANAIGQRGRCLSSIDKAKNGSSRSAPRALDWFNAQLRGAETCILLCFDDLKQWKGQRYKEKREIGRDDSSSDLSFSLSLHLEQTRATGRKKTKDVASLARFASFAHTLLSLASLLSLTHFPRSLARSSPSLSLFSLSPNHHPTALALIPDDDDLELISKARANRTERLAREKGAEAAFTNAEGFKASPLAGAQAAVFTLQRAGSQLDAGDASGAADTLNSGSDFVQAFTASAAKVSASSVAKASAAEAASRLSALRQASASGSDAKAAFAGAARAVAAWANDAGVAGSLQGL